MKSERFSDFDGNCQYSFPARYGMRHLRYLIRRCFAGLPECSSCPRFRRRCPARSSDRKSHRKIISHSAGHSVVTGVLGNKKSRHTNVYRLIKRAEFPPLVFWFHTHVTGFEIQSRVSFFPASARNKRR